VGRYETNMAWVKNVLPALKERYNPVTSKTDPAYPEGKPYTAVYNGDIIEFKPREVRQLRKDVAEFIVKKSLCEHGGADDDPKLGLADPVYALELVSEMEFLQYREEQNGKNKCHDEGQAEEGSEAGSELAEAKVKV